MANLPDMWRDMDRPFSGLGTWRPLLRQIDDLFNETMGTQLDSGNRVFSPACDIEETEDHFLLSFDMPGLEKDKIDIELQGNRLMVSGERRQEKEKSEGVSRFVERRYGRFERMVTLPEGLKTDQVEAQYTNGVLKVAVPKASEGKRQKVRIGDGEPGIFGRIASKLGGGKESNKTVDVRSQEEGNPHKMAQ